MKEDLKYPSMRAAASVLTKLGINPDSRLNDYAQDFEYTSCKLEELEYYLLLYIKEDTSDREKRVLGCYFVECLNDYLQENKVCHPKQNEIVKLLFDDKSIHKHELKYRVESHDSDRELSWVIAKYLEEIQ